MKAATCEPRSKQRVLLLLMPLPPPYSGTERVTAGILSSGLSERLNIVHCDISNKRSNADRGRLDRRNLFATGRVLARCWRALWTTQPDLVHVTIARNRWGFLKKAALVVVSRLHGAKVVARLTGADFDLFMARSTSIYRVFVRRILSLIQLVVVEGDSLKGQFAGLVPIARVRTVYGPFDVEPLRHARENRATARGASPVILFVGHLSVAKGAGDLLQALGEIQRQIGEISVVMLGNQIVVERNITHITSRRSIPDLLGEVRQIPSIALTTPGIVSDSDYQKAYQHADVFVFPSYSEGMPYALLDAISAGVPVVCTRVGAVPDVFSQDEVTYVEFGSPNGIAEAVVNVLRNPMAARQKAKQAHVVLSERFESRRFCDEFEALMNEV